MRDMHCRCSVVHVIFLWIHVMLCACDRPHCRCNVAHVIRCTCDLPLDELMLCMCSSTVDDVYVMISHVKFSWLKFPNLEIMWEATLPGITTHALPPALVPGSQTHSTMPAIVSATWRASRRTWRLCRAAPPPLPPPLHRRSSRLSWAPCDRWRDFPGPTLAPAILVFSSPRSAGGSI